MKVRKLQKAGHNMNLILIYSSNSILKTITDKAAQSMPRVIQVFEAIMHTKSTEMLLN